MASNYDMKWIMKSESSLAMKILELGTVHGEALGVVSLDRWQDLTMELC